MNMPLRHSRIVCFLIVLLTMHTVWAGTKINHHTRSIREWASCSGISDDTENLRKAISEAKNNAFILSIDCPLYINIGSDITKPIFIDNNTTVIFSKSGVINVNNIFVPAFVLANVHGISLNKWKILYTGSLPVDPYTNGFYLGESFYPATGITPATNAFNNVTLTNWLQANRNIIFSYGVFAFWNGIIDPMAVFFVVGDTFDVIFKNLSFSVPNVDKPDRYMPIAFGLIPGLTDNQVITKLPLPKKPEYALPHNIIFEHIKLDGYYFGWQGSGQNLVIRDVTAYHYSDLQDSKRNNIGGINKWFAPPHLIYLNYQNSWDSSLYNESINITYIRDKGLRVGLARDKLGDSFISGNALSLKIQANNSIVRDYISERPDGFLDVLSSFNLSFYNITARYNSLFVNNYFPLVRFPSLNKPYTGYQYISFNHMSLFDQATVSVTPPIHGNYDSRC